MVESILKKLKEILEFENLLITRLMEKKEITYEEIHTLKELQREKKELISALKEYKMKEDDTWSDVLKSVLLSLDNKEKILSLIEHFKKKRVEGLNDKKSYISRNL
ncbi:hypothetical protein SAMN06269117_10488 [Balnearium lithotrophicum]|uniref:Flagellar protein FliT n=1 Tax=Balnearium lithotrophicum TaxID=223788 RepID=A0A521B9Y7_9BACT|nr:hypothetical protein [Balnearium lithotrophicum]SMO43883.1 hypothetical protein SAMN06269117_10488 [Balnearium lithotrophicum]